MNANHDRADPDAFLAGLRNGGIKSLTGVPCSSLTGLINAAIDSADMDFVNAPNEGEALAFSAGAWMSGRPSAVLCQNSGLSNLSNALTSLIVPYRLPVLLIVGWRGQLGLRDEPQHRLVGRLTPSFLQACGVMTHTADASTANEIAEHCSRIVARGGPSQAILVPPNLFGDRFLTTEISASHPAAEGKIWRRTGTASMTRRDALTAIVEEAPGAALLIAPTGLASRELYDLRDSPAHFYMMGSMGHGAALGLGVAKSTSRPVVVLDGDGSILMRLGALAFVGAAAPANFLHIVLDNGMHESTGGQASLSVSVDLCAVAAACGYRTATEAGSTDSLVETMAFARKNPGPSFIRLTTKPERSRVPPRISLSAADIAARFSGDVRGEPMVAIDKRAVESAE